MPESVRATNGALVPSTPFNSRTTVWFGRGGGGEAWGGVGEGNLTTGLIWQEGEERGAGGRRGGCEGMHQLV